MATLTSQPTAGSLPTPVPLVAGQVYQLPGPGLNIGAPADNLALFEFSGNFGTVSGYFQASNDGVNFDPMLTVRLSDNTTQTGVQTINGPVTYQMGVQGRRNVQFVCNSVTPTAGGTISIRIDSGFFNGNGVPSPSAAGVPSNEASGTTPNGIPGSTIPVAAQGLYNGSTFDVSRSDGSGTGVIAASSRGEMRLQTQIVLLLQEILLATIHNNTGSGSYNFSEAVLASPWQTLGEDVDIG